MFIVMKEIKPHRTHPVDGGYICELDGLYKERENAVARMNEILAEPGSYAYLEEISFKDEASNPPQDSMYEIAREQDEPSHFGCTDLLQP